MHLKYEDFRNRLKEIIKVKNVLCSPEWSPLAVNKAAIHRMICGYEKKDWSNFI